MNDEIDTTVPDDPAGNQLADNKSHAVANLKVAAGELDDESHGMVFQDSDVYKWLEEAAYALAYHPDPELKALCDRTVNLIARAQQPDGYLDTPYQVKSGVWADRPRFSLIQQSHEMYVMGHYIEAAVAYHQVVGNEQALEVANKAEFASGLTVEQCSDFPWNGHVEYTVNLPASAADSSVRFGLRIPGWSLGSYALTVNGKLAVALPEDGFVYLMVNAGDTLELDMSVKFVHANSRVRSDAGQVAVMRGPLVYCAEQADNPGDLWNYRLADGVDAAAAKTEFQSDLLGGEDTVSLPAVREQADSDDAALYVSADVAPATEAAHTDTGAVLLMGQPRGRPDEGLAQTIILTPLFSFHWVSLPLLNSGGRLSHMRGMMGCRFTGESNNDGIYGSQGPRQRGHRSIACTGDHGRRASGA